MSFKTKILKNTLENITFTPDLLEKKNVVVFFYPKDDTPGCTKEAIEFSDYLVIPNFDYLALRDFTLISSFSRYILVLLHTGADV